MCAEAARDAPSRGQLDVAIRHYGQAIAEDGLSAENLAIINNNRGMAYWSRGQRDNAVADYDAAIRLQPDDAFAYENRGRAKRHVGQVGAAVDDPAWVVQLDPLELRPAAGSV